MACLLRHAAGFMDDLKFAFRQLWKNPGFAVVAVLTLALGIGATTAIFSVVYAVVLRELPFPEPERLVALWTRTPQVERLPMAASDHRDLRSQNTVFEDIAILRSSAGYNLTGDGEPERLRGARIPSNLFPLLRVQPLMGRGFIETENRPGEDRVLILSYGLWQRRYAADPDIVGKAVLLENIPHTVVGVMGPEFRYPAGDVQIWTPLTIDPENFQSRTGYAHAAVARLKPGVTLEQARVDLDGIAARLSRLYPEPNKDVAFGLAPLRQDVAGVARAPLVVLLGASAALLLIGCCNLANLLLARGLARTRENALRTALGATRGRLVRQAAAELLPVLAIGSVAGLFAAQWGVKLLIPALPAAIPRVEEVQVNLPVLLFNGGALVFIAALLVLLPAAQASRARLMTALREDMRTSSGSAGRATVRGLLVVGQVALSVMLLTGAGLLIRTFAALKEVDPGFRPEGVLSLQLPIPRNKYAGDDRVAAFCERILEQVRVLPGVEVAGMGSRLPLVGSSGLSTIEFERANQGSGTLEATDETVVTSGYFQAMNIPLLQGRSFTAQDATNAPLVVVVDQRVARLAWPGENPVGKRVRGGPNRPWATVVGVVGHVRHESLESERRLQIYWSHLQRTRDGMTLVVRFSGDARALVKPVLGAIRSVDSDQPVHAVRTMTEVLDRHLAMRRFNAVTVAVFAGSSLLLAMVGIYGVIAWAVKQRTREIGVRMALGAQRISILSLVLRNGFKLAGTGVLLGSAGAFALSHTLRGLLFGVVPADPFTFATVPLLLIFAALVACWLPARRAARVDPMVALRSD